MLEQLHLALSEAFTLQTLARMVTFKLQKDLWDYAAPGNKQQVIYELLDAAQREGFLEQLVLGARVFNPNNDKLREIARSYGLESTRKSTQELERIIDETRPNLDPVQLRQAIFDAETRVCRLEVDTPRGTLYGTGFLVAPDLVMTNHHVVDRIVTGAVPPGNVRARFDYKRTPARVVSEGMVSKLAATWLVDSSEPGPLDEPNAEQLDYAVLQLDAVPGPAGPEVPRGFYRIADRPLPQPDAALFIMQHPSGRAVELAMDTRAVLAVNSAGTRVHYRTNTEAGSSGSPCFSPSFDLGGAPSLGRPQLRSCPQADLQSGRPDRRHRGVAESARPRRTTRDRMS